MKTLVKFLYLMTVTVSVIFISSCTTLTSDIKIKTHADPDINYNAYKTYTWADGARVVFDPIGQWEQPTLDTDEEVRFIINRELRAHGLNQVEKDPDLLVAFAAGMDTAVLELKENPKHDKKLLSNTPKAALLIALIDANTGYTIWSGYAVGDVQPQQNMENIRKRIDYAVSRIFKPYNK